MNLSILINFLDVLNINNTIIFIYTCIEGLIEIFFKIYNFYLEFINFNENTICFSLFFTLKINIYNLKIKINSYIGTNKSGINKVSKEKNIDSYDKLENNKYKDSVILQELNKNNNKNTNINNSSLEEVKSNSNRDTSIQNSDNKDYYKDYYDKISDLYKSSDSSLSNWLDIYIEKFSTLGLNNFALNIFSLFLKNKF